MLDIGCGPLGTLEWASMTAERIGHDPLGSGSSLLAVDTNHEATLPEPISIDWQIARKCAPEFYVENGHDEHVSGNYIFVMKQ